MTKQHGLLAVALMLAASVGAAQQRSDEPRDRDTEARPRPSAAAISVDPMLVKCLIQANEAEIKIAKLAEEHASSKEVKDFATMMIKDHTACLGKLQKLHGTGRDTVRDGAREGAREERPREADAAGQASNARDHALFTTMHKIKDDLDQKCLETAIRELKQKEGTEFDKCFMGFQVGAHLKMADTLEVFKKYGSPELQSLLSEGEAMTKEHLVKAKSLLRGAERTASNAKDSDTK